MATVLAYVVAGIWPAWGILVIWASNQLNWHLRYGTAGTYKWLGQLGGPAWSRSEPVEWLPINLPIYILSGYYHDIEDPAVRRYGHIVRYSLFAWFGIAMAVLFGFLIRSYV